MGGAGIFELLIISGGFYLIYAAVVLKTRGEIIKGVMVSRDVNVDNIRDKEGFIRYMFPRVLLMGIFTVAMGGIHVLIPYMHWPAWISIAAVSGYLVLLMIFSAVAVKAGKKFI